MTSRELARHIDDEAAAWTARMDRGLSESDQVELDAWLAQDRRRVGALARARAIWLHAERADSLAPLIAEPVVEEIEAPRSALLSRRRMMIGGGGAMVAGLIGAVTFAPLLRRAPALRSGVGEIRRVPLSDGSVVTLDTDSALEVAFSDTARLVRLLSGAAYFEVAASSRPFLVEVGSMTLRAAASAFSVRALADNPLTVLVERGAVAMQQGEAKVDLAANTRATLTGGDLAALTMHRVAPEEVDRALFWRNGMLSFEGETLQEAAATFRRYGRPFIEIADPALARRPITGLFSANDPAGFARTAALSLDASATIDGDVARLMPARAR